MLPLPYFYIVMRIDIITVLPEMLEGFVNTSILARAQKKGLVEIYTIPPTSIAVWTIIPSAALRVW